MIKQEINIIVLIVYRNAFLSSHKGEIITHFSNKLLQFRNYGIFKVFLRIIATKPKKIKKIGIMKNEVSRHLPLIAQCSQVIQYHFFGLFCYGCTFIQHAIYFGFQSAD